MDEAPRYDVYRTEDLRMVLRDVEAADAAGKAGVSINFVVLSAAQHARNRYGRVATLTGYFFYPHGEIPDFELSRRERERKRQEETGSGERVVKRFVLDADILDAALKERGFATRQEFCRRIGLNDGTISWLINEGLAKYQPHNRCVQAVCTYLNLEPQRLLKKRFVKITARGGYSENESK